MIRIPTQPHVYEIMCHAPTHTVRGYLLEGGKEEAACILPDPCSHYQHTAQLPENIQVSEPGAGRWATSPRMIQRILVDEFGGWGQGWDEVERVNRTE